MEKRTVEVIYDERNETYIPVAPEEDDAKAPAFPGQDVEIADVPGKAAGYAYEDVPGEGD